MDLFYPSHDIALGNGVKHFNPPLAALRLQKDLAALSAIWQKNNTKQPIAWGWDYDTRAYLHKEYGIRLKDLPTDDELIALRNLSSRKTTIGIINSLKERHSEFQCIQTPEYIDNEASLKAYVDNHTEYVLKTPWSSSGRGLSISRIVPQATILKHGAATIRKMGGIVAEPWYDKVQDFAMLFYVGRESVDFIGYSLFDNDDTGTYRCGKLMSNERIEALLPPSCIIVRESLLDILTEMFEPFMHKTWEIGYVGIDMMVKKNGETNPAVQSAIHPCVEMNLRCTMGVVARMYFDSNIDKSQTGEFCITPALDYEKLRTLDNSLKTLHGDSYRRLTELKTESMFMAYVVFN